MRGLEKEREACMCVHVSYGLQPHAAGDREGTRVSEPVGVEGGPLVEQLVCHLERVGDDHVHAEHARADEVGVCGSIWSECALGLLGCECGRWRRGWRRERNGHDVPLRAPSSSKLPDCLVDCVLKGGGYSVAFLTEVNTSLRLYMMRRDDAARLRRLRAES